MIVLTLRSLAWSKPNAITVKKIGTCQSGYSSSGNYCLPNSNTRFAIPTSVSFPRSYSSSGQYFLRN